MGEARAQNQVIPHPLFLIPYPLFLIPRIIPHIIPPPSSLLPITIVIPSRCVDMKSPHYKEKLVVVDVPSSSSCDCRTDEDRLVEGVRTDK